MAWTFVCTELDGTVLGEVNNASERTWSSRLNGLAQARFTIRLDNPVAKKITDLDGDCLCKVYKGSTLLFVGDLTTAEEVAKGYTRTISRETLMNVGYSLGDAVRVAKNQASITDRGAFEEVVPSDTSDPGLRQSLIDEYVRVRCTPRVRITFDPGANPDDETLACNFQNPLWRLGKRFCLVDTGGVMGTDPSAVTFATTDRAQIVKALLDNANDIWDTGIRAGTFSTLYPSPAGPWSWKPIAEAYTEMSQARAYFFEVINLVTFLAQESFNTFTPPSNLTGRAADGGGGTWNVVGSTAAGDFTAYSGGPAASRNTTNEVPPGGSGPEALGAFAYLSSGPYTDQLVQVEIGYPGSYGQKQGVLARFNDTSPGNWLMATFDYGAQAVVSVRKCVGGTITNLVTSQAITQTAGEAYNLRLQVDTAGNWAVWTWHVGDSNPPAPILSGQDDDLATGGPLASGWIGMYDVNTTAASGLPRTYDTVRAQVLTTSMASQGLDFELVPTEPTPDVDGVQIATLNVTDNLGSVKTNAIFEFGTGKSTFPGYSTDYVVGDTVNGRAQYTNQTGTRFDALFRAYGIDVSIDKEGKATEKPNVDPDTA